MDPVADKPQATEQAAKTTAAVESRARKAGRLFAFCLLVSAVGAGLFARSVYADAEHSALQIGSELGKMAGSGEVRPVHLNGESINVVSSIEAKTFTAVLDEAEAGCKHKSAGLRDVVQGLAPEARNRLPADATINGTAGVMRKESEHRGFVACLVRDTPTKGEADFFARMQRFAETGNLAEIGNLRYVYAKATSTGKAHVVVAWTDGPLNLKSLLAEDGKDAPGSDVADFPRPPDAVRLLTAEMTGVPYGIRLYESTRSPSDVVRSYDEKLINDGWERTQMERDPNARAYSRGSIDVLLFAEQTKEKTMVSVVNMTGQ